MLVDLHWNPQLEAQAQDRVYRMGQKKTVYIYQWVYNSRIGVGVEGKLKWPFFVHRFLTTDTVEERIKNIQEHKKEIANNILTGTRSTGGNKLTIDELKKIFEM